MSVRISHSGVELYNLCNRKYKLQNIDRLIPVQKGSALFVGTAFDAAFNDILLNFGKTNEELIKIGLDSFNRAWFTQEDRYLGTITLCHNPDIIYSKKDFEDGILTEQDGESIEGYFQDILPDLKEKCPNNDYPFETGYELFQHLREISRSFTYWNETERSFYNFVNWLSIKRKAPYFIKAYVENLVPHIEKVVSIQTELSMKDGEDTLTGIADMVLQLKPGIYNGVEVKAGENLICDNKTSSKLYARDTVELSSQLSKYKEILNEPPHNMNITKGAYFVVVKELKQIKNKTCKSCGHKSTGLAKLCDNKIGKKRCNGEWSTEITYEAQTQIVVDTISEETAEKAMIQVGDTILKIKNEEFEPNLSACDFQFGQPCAYRAYCHGGDMTGLVKVEKKK